MAKRVFSLPKDHELTKTQRRAIRAPLEGRHLVIGAPGTGKSVVALKRLEKHKLNGSVYFLTYNHVLNHANQALTEMEEYDNMTTAKSWLYKKYNEIMGCNVPEIKPYLPNYDIIIEDFDEKHDYSDVSVIVDEGQDLPEKWYESLEALNIDNFYIVADQNQQITEHNSSNTELRRFLDIDKKDIIKLTENWRNSTPIAALANYFYTDKSSPRPEIPLKPSAYTPILYEYSLVNSAYDLLTRAYDNDPSKLIGVIVSNKDKRHNWYNKLKSLNSTATCSRNISTYDSENDKSVNIDFTRGGICVLCDRSAKGLEFDEVYIVIDGLTQHGIDLEPMKKRMYVMTSRARDRLYLFKSASIANDQLESILPSPNETITISSENGEQEIELLKRISI